MVQRRLCSTSSRCWNCNAVLSNDQFQKSPFFCFSCHGIQPVDENISHFQRMEWWEKHHKTNYDLDVSRLQKFFRELQSKLHPDRFSQKSEREQSFSAGQSSAVNKAYRTLLRPLSRGLYMLELAGYPVEEGDSDVDPSFLMEIMELNEKLSELNDLDEIKKIGDVNAEKLKGLMKELSIEFENKNYEKAREVLMRLKYYATLTTKSETSLVHPRFSRTKQMAATYWKK
ncbi:putative iron-sulfur cluster co-chaperone protein HscB, mitochondrial-like [Apostichopus japonicus]|uniref:Putative iron-sulfur cluster co-chaperone protein HscB, mitochondrial-like n=1 Tax=Stichopus japonicus TaxID=307972 RepID=A0A2G8KKW3_STIJA|nr:putative iron-sulfur cluster co-chaperone protein HscB, mitochondrial-like [Apostichopus japonicus]